MIYRGCSVARILLLSHMHKNKWLLTPAIFMPISGDEWDEAHNCPNDQVILEFLHNNPDQAFTTIEIAENININYIRKQNLTPSTVGEHLQQLSFGCERSRQDAISL